MQPLIPIDAQAFHFLRPLWLLSLLPLIPLLWAARRNTPDSSAWSRVCDPALLRHLTVGSERQASRWPLALWAAGWVSAGLALAGPTWERLPTPSFREPSSTVLVMNLSPSMDATDVMPSRLTRARYKALDLLRRDADGQFAMVVFGEEPCPVTPLCDDPKVVADVVPLLETSLMPGRGVHVGRALDEARDLLAQAGAVDARILLVTDSAGDDPTDAERAARDASAAGYAVSVIGVGTGDGEARGARGRFAAPGLDESALRRLAAAGGGHFAPLTADDDDLETALPRQLPAESRTASMSGSAASRGASPGVDVDTWADMGVWLVLIPLLLAPLAFRRGLGASAPALVLLAGMSGPMDGESALTPWFQRPDQRATAAFEAGEHARASELFEDESWRAASLYRDGRYEEAEAALAGRTDIESLYNRGNALARQQRLQEAIAAYDQVLAQDEAHEDARFNRDLLQQLLDQQQEEEEQQQEQDQQQEDSGDGESQEPQDPQDGSDASEASESEASESEDQQAQEDPSGSEDQQGQDDQAGQQDQSGSQEQPSQEDQAGQQEPQDGGETSGQQGQPSDAEQDGKRSSGASQESGADEDEASAESPDASYEEVTGSEPEQSASTPPAAEVEATDELPDAPPSAVQPGDEDRDGRPMGVDAPGGTLSEDDQAVEQWLGRIPDDPAGLLRERIRRRYVERQLRSQRSFR